MSTESEMLCGPCKAGFSVDVLCSVADFLLLISNPTVLVVSVRNLTQKFWRGSLVADLFPIAGYTHPCVAVTVCVISAQELMRRVRIAVQ